MNILLVDNDKNTIETLKAILTTKTDYKIDVAYGGKKALKKMKKNEPYNLLILDVMMPKVNGIDVCESMTLYKKLKKIPVLLISALPISSKAFQESLREFAKLDVIKDVIEKPFSSNNLLAKIEGIIGK